MGLPAQISIEKGFLESRDQSGIGLFLNEYVS